MHPSSTAAPPKYSRRTVSRFELARRPEKASRARTIRQWAATAIVGLLVTIVVALASRVPSTPSKLRIIASEGVVHGFHGYTELEETLEVQSDAVQEVPEFLHVAPSLSEEFTFKFLEPDSLTYADASNCCQGLEHLATESGLVQPVDNELKFLLILGAQKAGTTWLYDALTTHPLFVGADHGFRRHQDHWSKELHFFDQWPQGATSDFLDCFPVADRMAALNEQEPTVFVDATPEYLFTPGAALRASQIIPQAKIVIVLRDPVARSLSAVRMVRSILCEENDWPDVVVPNLKADDSGCVAPTFAEVVRMETSVEATGLAQKCLFNSLDPEAPKVTWADCWGCLHTVYKRQCPSISETDQKALGGCPPARGMPTTHVSLYAAQIAWWLSFFPPDRFLILQAKDLRNPESALEALNKIIEHMDIDPEDLGPFDADEISNVVGFQGNYNHSLSAEEHEAARALSDFYSVPNKDLKTLMDTFFPSAEFQGFESEFGLEF